MAWSTGEKVGAWVGGGVLFSGLASLLFWLAGKKSDGEKVDFDKKKKVIFDKKKFEEGDYEKRGLFKAGAKTCSGVPYNELLHEGPDDVVDSMRSLGYTLTKVESARGIEDIKAFQRKARLLNLRGMKGKSDAWIDGDMGACTLIALEDALEMKRKGTWTL